MSREPNVTELIQRWQAGDNQALQQLTPYVYDELRRLARSHMRRESSGHTLQATALVNEAFLKLAGAQIDYQSRSHFFATAARTMRRILVDHARAKHSDKRGGKLPAVTFEEGNVADDAATPSILELDMALDKLKLEDERLAQAVELMFFGGLTYEETASVLGISRTSLYKDVVFAKAWLKSELG